MGLLHIMKTIPTNYQSSAVQQIKQIVTERTVNLFFVKVNLFSASLVCTKCNVCSGLKVILEITPQAKKLVLSWH